MNLSDAKVYSLDIPFGFNPDTVAVIAEVTLTFEALKQGLLTDRARVCVGKWLFVDISLTNYLPIQSSRRVSLDFVRQNIVSRSKYSYKED